MTSTYQLVRELGLALSRETAEQQVLQLQSATDTPKKIVLGERPIMADGNNSNVLLLKETGKPYRGCLSPPKARLRSCSHRRCSPPRRIRMPRGYSRTICSASKDRSCSSILGGLRSLHTLVKDKPGRTPLSAIKVWKDDPAAVETQGEEIKRRYSRIFHV